METKGFDIDELHKKQYEILIEFDRVCKKYGLTYFLAYGTLLGAVRHKGFIPWDDDIDTLMPYEDFLKVKKIPASEWQHPFFLQNGDTDKQFNLCFQKVRNSETTLITEALSHLDINQGVDIDIYPLIGLADDPKKRKRQFFDTKAFMLLNVGEPPVNHGKAYYLAGKIILGAIPKKLRLALRNHFLKRITQYKNTKDCYVVNGNLEVMRQVLSSSWFKSMVDAPFEDRDFPIPNGAKDWLLTRYGANYMDLPPVEKRGFKLDGFVKVDVDHSYKDYKGTLYCKPNAEAKKVRNNRWVGKDG